MKKIFFVLLFASFVIQSYSQKGDLFLGAQAGYISSYKDVLFGVRTAYNLSDPLELNLSFMMNPNITLTSSQGDVKYKMYATSLDFHYYVIRQRTWGMGPIVGGQYAYLKEEQLFGTRDVYTTNALGLNLGWHLRYDITENIKLNGGWRYAAMNNDLSNHLFYIGLGYTFNLY